MSQPSSKVTARWALCIASSAFLLIGRAAFAEATDEEPIPTQLSLPQAEQIFSERGLDLLIAEYGAEGAEGDLKSAGAHPNPGLDFSMLYSPTVKNGAFYSGIDVFSVWGFQAGVTDNAALEDQLSGKRSLRIEAASKALASAQINIADVKRLELSQLRQAYTAAVLARLNVQAAKDSFDTFDKQLTLNQRRYDEGAINGLDLSRARQAQLEALQTLDQAQSGLKQAMASLLFLLGVRTVSPEVTLTSGIALEAFSQLKGATVASLHALALSNRTDVKMATATFEQDQVLVRQAKRARFPDLSLSIGYSEQCKQGSCSSQPAFNAGVQGTVPLLYQQQGEIKRAESNLAAADRTLAKVKAQVLSDVTQALAGFLAAKSQVERMEDKLLEQAKVSRDLAQIMYQKGAASFIDFMDAQRQYVASRLEYNQDLANYWVAVYQLEQATAVRLR